MDDLAPPPIKVLLSASGNPPASTPIAVFSLPVLMLDKANLPTAVLVSPVVLRINAATPIAVLLCPVVLLNKALLPQAVQLLAVVLEYRAPAPFATFPWPVALKNKAMWPVAVLPTPS